MGVVGATELELDESLRDVFALAGGWSRFVNINTSPSNIGLAVVAELSGNNSMKEITFQCRTSTD